jgi:hypothetical protein
LYKYILRKTTEDSGQILGYVATTRDALGMEKCILGDRQYRVSALDGTVLKIFLGSTGMTYDSYRGSLSLFVRLESLAGVADPVSKVMRCVEKIWGAEVGGARIPVLKYRREGRRTGKADGSQGTWHVCASAEKRDLDSVVMDKGRREQLVQDIRRFVGNAALYRRLKIPFKRSYLLYGPPGTGKTSLIRALATLFGWSVCDAQITPLMTDEDVVNMFLTVPPKTVLILEDVDRIVFAREDGGKDPAAAVGTTVTVTATATATATAPATPAATCKVTLQGLLNAMDGAVCSDELDAPRVTVLTANNPERLDPALKRPGRVDIHVQMDAIKSKEIVVAMLRRFFGLQVSLSSIHALADKIMQVSQGSVAPCSVEALCIRFAVDGVQAAMQAVDTFLLHASI